jgi:hypothetical protein
MTVPVLAGLLFTDEVLDDLAQRVAVRLGTQDQRPEPFVGIQAAADFLGVPVARLHKLNSQRRSAKHPIPLHKHGQRCFYRLSELAAWREQAGQP